MLPDCKALPENNFAVIPESLANDVPKTKAISPAFGLAPYLITVSSFSLVESCAKAVDTPNAIAIISTDFFIKFFFSLI